MSIFGFHSHEHSSSNYCGNAYERGNQFDIPGTTGLTSPFKVSRITLDFAIGLQEIKRTVWKVSVFGVILVRILPHSAVQMWENNTDENNSEYGHFLRSVFQNNIIIYFFLSVFVVADLAHLIISLFGSHLKQGVLGSRYLEFIAKMGDKVKCNIMEERLSILFFLITLKTFSSSALLCGNTKRLQLSCVDI